MNNVFQNFSAQEIVIDANEVFVQQPSGTIILKNEALMNSQTPEK